MPICAVDLDGLEPSSANGYKTTDEGLKVLGGSAKEQGPLVERREIKQGVQKSRVRVETIDVRYREKFEQAMRDNAVDKAKTFIADPQAIMNGDRVELAMLFLGVAGKEAGVLIKEVKALRYGNNLVELGEQVAKHSDEVVDAAKEVGHLTPWVQMTKEEARAFQHSYSRHASELGLPNWSQTKAAELQGRFNNAVSNIRNVGSKDFFRSQEFVNGVKTTVNRTEPLINGQRFYYYETLEGKFISAGKIQ